MELVKDVTYDMIYYYRVEVFENCKQKITRPAYSINYAKMLHSDFAINRKNNELVKDRMLINQNNKFYDMVETKIPNDQFIILETLEQMLDLFVKYHVEE